MRRRASPFLLAALALTALTAAAARADTASVAVAANFSATLDALAAKFEQVARHKLRISAGSTGQLYAQITKGAPFNVFLAADERRPKLLAREELGDTRTRFTYAVGRLVLWTNQVDKYPKLDLAVLRTDRFRWLAIANPKLAPYGAAAQQTLQRLGLWKSLAKRIVQGQNITQAFAMTESRSADLGLVALSQAVNYTDKATYVEVPADMYAPIRQDAILLEHGRGNRAAVAFLKFLAGPDARAIIEKFGYEVPATEPPP